MTNNLSNTKREVYTNPALTVDYCGNMIYEGGTLKQILIEGGYVTFSGSTPVYHYYLQDHQGNNRVVVSRTGTVEEVNHYYPYGMLFGESINPERQRFKYNGKEVDRMHGLHMYDYGARHYDPALCRFSTMDPMCEKYYTLSPYTYCGNNPVNAIDLKGDSIFVAYEHQQQILEMINELSNGEFDIDDNGYLYLKSMSKYHPYRIDKYSNYYRDALVYGINSSNKISVSMASVVMFKNTKLSTKDYGEGFTIIDGNQAYVYISGKEYKTSNKTTCNPQTILAHELAGHAIPSMSSLYTDPRYDGLAVTAENVIRYETGQALRIWGDYEKDHRSVSSLINPFGRIIVNKTFPIIKFD